jgi:probable rRNA maturation factor
MQVIIVNNQNEARVNIKRLKAAALKALKVLGLTRETSLGISFVSKRKIRSLNKKFFKKDTPTDVIAFEYGIRKGKVRGSLFGKEFKYYLGDIIICPRIARENSKIFDNTFFDELILYITHGVLHLLGYDDRTRGQKEKMRKIETKVLARLG